MSKLFYLKLTFSYKNSRSLGYFSKCLKSSHSPGFITSRNSAEHLHIKVLLNTDCSFPALKDSRHPLFCFTGSKNVFSMFENFPLSQLNTIRCSFQDGRFCSFLKPVLENFAWQQPLFYRLISKGRVKFSGLSSAEYPMVPSCINKS